MGYKRAYFENARKEVLGYQLSITSGGTVYFEEQGTLKKLTHWQYGPRLFVELPDKNVIFLFLEGNELRYDVLRTKKENTHEENNNVDSDNVIGD